MGRHDRPADDPAEERTEVIVVAGGTSASGRAGIETLLAQLLRLRPDAAVVHHDLCDLTAGVVSRRLRTSGSDETTALELAHGCVSCTLREDLLPLLRRLGRLPGTGLVVLHLDAVLEPEQVCFAIEHVVVDGAPVTDTVDLAGVITVLDVGAWLDDATGDVDLADLADLGLAPIPDDERTLAQLVVAQAEFADLLVLTGDAEAWELARTTAVLDRLNPLAARLPADRLDERVLLGFLPSTARRGRPESEHAPLLRGQPPLSSVAGIRLVLFTARRPFHPERLHEAVDVLLDGVVRARGRFWLATRPDAALWLESAGGGLQVGHAGDWLPDGTDAGATAAWQEAEPERVAAASLAWHPRWGERAQELAVLVHDGDPGRIEAALRAALLTDSELAEGDAAWALLPDPFGFWHTDPCADFPTPTPVQTRKDEA